ncbi:MAG: CHAD domain-containing protein, partial [Myxococcaceae bacterium]|nr:CHAD domain-containing protein [Myxococcaceae bacterium]
MSALRGRTIAATAWRGQLEAALADVREDPGAEPVHRLRVASERLKVWLTLSGDFALRRELSWLRSRAGRLRDLDVRLAMEVPGPLAARWRAQRSAARRALVAPLRSARVAKLLAAL